MLVLNELKRLDDHVANCEDSIRKEVSDSETRITDMLSKLEQSYTKTRDDVIRLKAITTIVGASAGFFAGMISKFLG